MSDQWFYEKNGSEQGPVSEDELRQKKLAGEIQSSSQVWKEGLAGWVTYESALGDSSAAASSSSHSPSQPLANSSNPYSPPVAGAGASYNSGVPGFVPREARVNDGYSLSIREAFGTGWRVMAKQFWPMVGFFALAFIIYSLASQILIPIFFMTLPLMGGFMFFTLRHVRGLPGGDIDTIFEGFKRRFGSLAMITLVLTLPLFIGFLILCGVASIIGFATLETQSLETVIDGAMGVQEIVLVVLLIAAVLFLSLLSIVLMNLGWFAGLICLDCELPWQSSLKMAWRGYRQKFFKITIFSILANFLLSLGFLVVFVGGFVTGAWVVTAYSVIYEKAFGDGVDVRAA